MPNKLSQFWQELKRRRVIHVIVVYATAAFVILELIDIISEPFGLPYWTLKLVFVLLCVGLVISIIFSWIYDMTPEGIEKTKPAREVPKGEKTTVPNSWRIASYISFVVIVGLIILNVIPRTKGIKAEEVLEKSIAVLPFIDDSPDKNNGHIINGIMEDLLINLQSIKDLRVPGRSSTEQYRDNLKPIPEIATEMNVTYIVEGSGQRYGDKIRLRVQLVEGATDKHVWAASYDEVINGTEDIFRIQSEIAQSIATELQAVITPTEKELIEKIATSDLTALDFYQRGEQERWNGESERAEYYFNEALKYDPSFAQAYTGLAWVYRAKHFYEDYFSENVLDSVRILADKALSYDPELSEAYTVKGEYYRQTGNPQQAMLEYEKAVQFNPNDWMAYRGMGILSSTDFVKAIENFHKAVSLNRGAELPSLLYGLGAWYFSAGFIDRGRDYYGKALALSGDSLSYYYYLAYLELYSGNFTKAEEIGSILYETDSNSVNYQSLIGFLYILLDRYEEALELYERYYETAEIGQANVLFDRHRIGWVYWKNGYKEEAGYLFNEQIEYCLRMNELGRSYSLNMRTFYDLAATYAFIGEKEKAYESLKTISQQISPWIFRFITLLEHDPLFDNLRDEPEFQQIANEIEAKYQAEHERVRRWLEENEIH